MAGIYVHIPFCKKACTYCNFHFSTSLRLKDELLNAIHTELSMQKDYLGGKEINTIYLGGGTPSLLSEAEINSLFEHINSLYPLTGLQEFTLEANPDDLNTQYIKSLRNTPVSRLSIGVQSFRDSDLQYMNRAHNAAEADYAIKACQDAGFADLTIDLIYGTPGLDNNSWRENLAKPAELEIPHFSAYALTVEEGTKLHHDISKRRSAPVDNEQAAAQFSILMDEAAVLGYEHYEISNFALPGRYAVHNTNYWKGKHYLGIGPSAHSYNGSERRWNIANNALYIKAILQEHTLPFESETLSPEQALNEYIMTSLRTKWGCDLKLVEERWGAGQASRLLGEAEQFILRDWLRAEESKLILTVTGKLFADRIASELFIIT